MLHSAPSGYRFYYRENIWLSRITILTTTIGFVLFLKLHKGQMNVARRTYHQGTGVGGLALAPEKRNGDTYTVIHYDQVRQYQYYFDI